MKTAVVKIVFLNLRYMTENTVDNTLNFKWHLKIDLFIFDTKLPCHTVIFVDYNKFQNVITSSYFTDHSILVCCYDLFTSQQCKRKFILYEATYTFVFFLVYKKVRTVVGCQTFLNDFAKSSVHVTISSMLPTNAFTAILAVLYSMQFWSHKRTYCLWRKKLTCSFLTSKMHTVWHFVRNYSNRYPLVWWFFLQIVPLHYFLNASLRNRCANAPMNWKPSTVSSVDSRVLHSMLTAATLCAALHAFGSIICALWKIFLNC